MPPADQTVRTYRELAEGYGRQGQAQMRDRFLVLAADAALAAGQEDEAERLRVRLLQHNPHHLLKPYSCFAEAMKSSDVQHYVGALRRNHPYEKAEHLLESLRQKAAGQQHEKARPPATASPSPETAPAARKEPQEAREDLKVFRVADTGNEPKADPPPIPQGTPLPSGPKTRPPLPGTSPPPARPVVGTQPAQPAPPARPAVAPEIFRLRRKPDPLDKLRTPDIEDRGANSGAWVSAGLFLLLLVAGILWGAYTLLRPFLPREWF